MLHQQLGHHQPSRFGGGVGVVRPVDLEDLPRRHDELGFRRVHEGAIHVDVAVENVVLRVLVGAVHTFFSEQHSNFRPGDARHVTVKIDRAANLILDQVAGFPAGAQLLAGDRHAADPLGCALHQPIDMALPGGADHHQMVCAVPGRHAHAAQVILETAGGNFRRHHAFRLRVDMVKVF